MNGHPPSLSTKWNRFWFQRVAPDSLGLLRLFYGAVLVAKMTGGTNPRMLLQKGLHFPKRGIFDISEMLGSWSMPYSFLQWLPEPTPFWYDRIEDALLLLSLCVCAGLFTRLVVPLTAVLFSYTFLLSQLSFLHNSFLFMIVLWILSFTPCGRTYSLDALLSAPENRLRSMSILPLRLIGVLLSSVYLFTFLSKCNHGWLSGQIMVVLDQWGMTGPFAEHVMLRIPPQVRSLSALAVEGILSFALLIPSLGRAGLFLGVGLHLAIDLSMGIGVFSYQMLALYIVFIHPGSGATVVLYDSRCRPLAACRRWIRLFDWYRRLTWLDIRDAGVSSLWERRIPGTGRGELHVLTAEGRHLSGFVAFRDLLTRLPATFMVTGLLRLPAVRRAGERAFNRLEQRELTRTNAVGDRAADAGIMPPWQQTLQRVLTDPPADNDHAAARSTVPVAGAPGV